MASKRQTKKIVHGRTNNASRRCRLHKATQGHGIARCVHHNEWPVPVITGAMFQKLAADASDDDNSDDVQPVADVLPNHRVTLPNSNRCSFSWQLSQLSKASLQEGLIIVSSACKTMITMLDRACHRYQSLCSSTSSNTSRTVAKKCKTHSPADNLSFYPR
jgi:hypothetical protein